MIRDGVGRPVVMVEFLLVNINFYLSCPLNQSLFSKQWRFSLDYKLLCELLQP